MAADIAVISFDRFLHGDEDERRAVAKEVYHAFSTTGWVYLKDHGIPQSRVDEMFELNKTFFALPLATKSKYQLTDPLLNQGYTADGAESLDAGVDHKESYEHRRFHNPLRPNDSDLPGFHTTTSEFYTQCLQLGQAVLSCLALALGLSETYFDPMTRHADPQLRAIHYPALPRSVVDQNGHARIRPHTDYGFCTLLFQDAVGGLEVDAFHTGEFRPANPVPETVLVNIADLLQRLTNDRCRSTRHRVVSPRAERTMVMNKVGEKEEEEWLPARYSIAFFIHPDPETVIDPITLRPDEEKRYPPVNAGEWRVWKTKTTYGFGAEDAPPPVAAPSVAVA